MRRRSGSSGGAAPILIDHALPVMTQLSREDYLDRARELVPVLQQRAEAAEALRRIPDEPVRDFHDSGLVRVIQPRRVGGGEMDFTILLEIGAELARGCGSSAWVWSNLATHHWMLGMWTEEAQDELWGISPDILVASSFAFPAGRAQRVEGGYRLSGQWPFSSGVDCCTWTMVAGMVEGEGGSPPEHRVFLLPEEDYEIIDNWHVAGLCATGSKDVAAREAFVPAYRTITPKDWRGGESPGSGLNPGALFRLPVLSVFPYCLSGVAVGIAQGAWDAYVGETRARRSTYTGASVADYPTVQLKVAEVDALIDAARLLMARDCDEAMAVAAAGDVPAMETKLRYHRNGAFGTNLCMRAVDLMFTASGGKGLFNSHPIQRAFRDIHAAAAHISMNWEPAAIAHGRVALGLPPDNPLL